MIRAAGGSALNSARTIQCLLPPMSSVFVGAVGDDSNGAFLFHESSKQGVEMHLQTVPNMATSTCVCYITPDHERTLVVHGAAHHHYTFNATFVAALDTVDIVYIVSFVLSASTRYECAVHAATHLRPNQLLCMNLSSTNLLHKPVVMERLLTLLPSTHVVLGNANEFRALAIALDIPDTSMPALAQAIATHPAVSDHILLIVTDAANPTWVVHKSESMACPVQRVQDSTAFVVRDTTGAGDAFVGGFLAGLMTNCNVRACVELGHVCARRCVQQMGCQIQLTAGERNRCQDIIQAARTADADALPLFTWLERKRALTS
ncbi:hypothetical protein, variant 2 [Aphanomyces invadans]|uniref:Adenosine kinase n=2 Tax=Aphanomyces invadans TaxID=157072 RepID=A0A024ULH7_9STRA|nr:hypothetical protein, variant 1 [Aphanomyces invadans]XP_008863257.1 hypothetical protein, variant 2 [Aphanomyces invadans]ETW07163.1 hypothetical protein, variant 1 [Aphanomyces invadans]ETW07164.1 hypothetical protein, variant 2 [Aphanomyces invadans]|eukprot:XP_008863256.1 hypothetical protein, variant 1 [Aphanomyces invadans]